MPIVYPNPIAGIYMIRCKISGKAYVGSSKNIDDRWRRHRGALRRGKHHSYKLQSAWNKYGEDAFEFKVLEVVSNGFIGIIEQAYINKYDAYKNGYNCARMTCGGSGGGARGEKNGKSKLTQKVVDSIRHEFNHEGRSIAVLAREHNTSEENVSRVLDNETWRDESYIRTRKPTKTKQLVAQKLTMKQADEIRELHKSKEFNRKQLAIKYGIHVSQINRILSNTAWINPSYISNKKTIRKPTVITTELRQKVIELSRSGEWTEPLLTKHLDIPRSALQRIKKEARLSGLLD